MLSSARVCLTALLLFAFVAVPLPISGLTTAWTEENSYNSVASRKYVFQKMHGVAPGPHISIQTLQEAEKSQDILDHENGYPYVEVKGNDDDAEVSTVKGNIQAMEFRRMLQQNSNSGDAQSNSQDSGNRRQMNMMRRMNARRPRRNSRDRRILGQNSNGDVDYGRKGMHMIRLMNIKNSDDRRILQQASSSNDNSNDGASGNMRQMNIRRRMNMRNSDDRLQLQESSNSNENSNDGASAQ